jgi:hypothetical protein
MSADEIRLRTYYFPYQKSSRALLAALSAVLIAVAFGIVTFLTGSHLLTSPHRAAVPHAESSPAPASWKIEGALTEACTCSVPCTCNFGEGPSPHNYCYAFYSYDIRKGSYNDVKLDGLRFGGADLKNGSTFFIDERADEKQREALRVILARVIERASAEDAEKQAKELAKEIRYTTIKQEYDNRRNRLEVKGVGEFAADYIMGLDKTQPVIVRNNTTWRIMDAIKAKTTIYRVKVEKDKIDVKNTNSNQGDFEYTDKTDFGSPAEWSCGACASNHDGHANKGEAMCGR